MYENFMMKPIKMYNNNSLKIILKFNFQVVNLNTYELSNSIHISV
jgi:hypothetical protein